MNSRLVAVAEDLRRRHIAGDPMLVPNAWDPSSARAVVRAGYPAVATSVRARTAARGMVGEDGPASADEAFTLWAAMARASGVALMVDTEPAYDLEPEVWAQRLVGAGIAGATVAFSGFTGADPFLAARGIQRLRSAVTDLGVPLVLSARIDSGADAPARLRLREAVECAFACLEAGADCVFPADLATEDEIAAFVRAVRAPVQVLLRPGGPPIGRLAALGVRRVGFGSGRPAPAAATAVRRAG